jgi:GH18 family chitinase
MLTITKKIGLACLLACLTFGAKAQKIMGYLPEYQYYANSNICYNKYTDVAYSFMNPTTTGTISYTTDALFGFNASIFDAVKAKCNQNGVNLWIAIGGADNGEQRSARLNAVTGNSTYRSTFITAIVNFAITHNLEGIDVDWEFPKTSGEIANHKQFVVDLRAKINASAKPGIKIGVTVGGEYLTSPNHLNYIDATVFASADYVNVMTYDFPVGHPSAGVDHSSVTNTIGSITAWNVQKSVAYSKIRMGLPFYGKGSVDRNANNGGIAFSTIFANNSNAINTNNVTISGTTYYYSGKTQLEDKITQGFAKGINGVIVWDMAQDNSACALSDVVYNKVNSTCAVPQPNLGLDVSVCKVGDTKVLDATVAPGSGNTVQWYKDDVLINSATSQTYTASSAGTYKIVYSTATCSKQDAVVLSVGSNITTQGTTTCAGNDATVSIVSPSTGSNFSWWDASTGGTQLATGTRSYTVTGITASKNIYAQEESATAKSFNVGPVVITDNSSAWAQLTKLGQFAHYIDVKQNLSIQSLKLYIAKSFVDGSTIKLVAYNVDGKTVVKSSTPQAVTKLTTASYEPVTLTANLDLVPGQYFICVEGTAPSYSLVKNDGVVQTLAQADISVMDGSTTVMTMQGQSVQRFSATGFINLPDPSGGITTNYGMLFDIKLSTGAAASNCGRALAAINVNAAANTGLTVVSKTPSICVGNSGTVTLKSSEVGIQYKAYMSTATATTLVEVGGLPVTGDGSDIDFTISAADLTTAASTGTVAIITIQGTKSGCGSLPMTDTAGIVLKVAPVAPGTITFTSPACIGSQNQAVSITAVPTATSYTWAYSGNGGTFGATTAATTLSFSPTATSGDITVMAVNTCGSSAAGTAKSVVITPKPSKPGAISFTTPVCAGASNKAVSVANQVLNATSYTWKYSGTGVTYAANTISTTASFASNATSGDIILTAIGTCGATDSDPLAVTIINTPAAPGTITFVSPVCAGASNKAVSVTAVPNATSYNWSYSGNGASFTTATATSAVSFSSVATSGNISVTATGTCGTSSSSPVSSVVVNKIPATPSVITGNQSITTAQNGVAYSVVNDPTVTTYNWTYTPSSGVTLNGTTSAITADIAKGASAGTLSVTATNSCGTSAASTKQLSIILSIDDNNIASSLNVSPNPSNHSFNLSLSNVSEIHLSITTLIGNEVETVNTTASNVSFGSNLAAGMYIVNATINGKSVSFKVSKQ